jgi:2-succinyl-5-enolpyruvyl-6-hydroxy-3-cyclohexene-1-carboxylate synthase
MIYTIIKYRKNLKSISKKFTTNLMLVVTEVNGCQIFSYFHMKQEIDSKLFS